MKTSPIALALIVGTLCLFSGAAHAVTPPAFPGPISGGGTTPAGTEIKWIGYPYTTSPAALTILPKVDSFFHGGPWLNFLPPKAPDVALFDVSANELMPRTVTFGDLLFRDFLLPNPVFIPGGDASIAGLIIRKGNFQFQFSDQKDKPQGSLSVGLNPSSPTKIADSFRAVASLEVTGGGAFVTFSPVQIAGGERSTGLLQLDGTGVIQTHYGYSFNIGQVGAGRMNIKNGAQLFSKMAVTVGVGIGSQGALEVASGGHVSLRSTLYIGTADGSQGSVQVHEVGSRMDAGTIRVGGKKSIGTLSTQDHGLIQIFSSLALEEAGGGAIVDVGKGGSIEIGRVSAPAAQGEIRVGTGGSITGSGTVKGGIRWDGGTIAPEFFKYVRNKPQLEFTPANVQGREALGKMTFIVRRTSGADLPGSVIFSTVNGQAKAGVDFVATTRTLEFPAGTSEVQVDVPLLDNHRDDPTTRSFLARLSNPTGAAQLGKVITASADIVDDDAGRLDLVGSFSGLVTGGDGAALGAATLTFTPTGAFSGKFTFGATPYSFRGALSDQGVAGPIILDAARGLTLEVSADFTGAGGDEPVKLVLKQKGAIVAASAVSATASAKFRWGRPGVFHLAFPPTAPSAGDTPANRPAGIGYGRLRVNDSGLASLNVIMCDGTLLTQGGHLTAGGKFHVYGTPYSGGSPKTYGVLSGTLTLAVQGGGENDVSGLLNWQKPSRRNEREFPNGFRLKLETLGSFFAPRPGILIDAASFDGELSAGNFTAPIRFGASQVSLNRLTIALPNSANVTIKLSADTGTFSGTFNPPGTSAKVAFRGTALPLQGYFLGFFTGHAATGNPVEAGAVELIAQ